MNQEIIKHNDINHSEDPETIHLKTIKSFVKRQGRITKAQQNAIENSQNLLNNLDDYHHPNFFDLDILFGHANTTRTLEIGFGNGASLLQMAIAEPDRDFLGIEVHKAGVGKLLSEIQRKEIRNIKIADDDAFHLIKEKFLPDSFDCIQVFFPDPWHKKAHNKRRLVQDSFLEAIYPLLQKEGVFHFATDWTPYALEVLELLKKSTQYESIYDTYHVRPTKRPLTKFEQRGINLGHQIWDLMFKKI